MKKRILVLLALLAFSCEQSVIETETKLKTHPVRFVETAQTTTTENFESASKTSYSAGSINLATGSWYFSDALLGYTSSDRKIDSRSVRIRNTGEATMSFNLSNGASTVTVKHATYGSDGASSWSLQQSTTNGSSWTNVGHSVTSSSVTLETATFSVNHNGAIRFRILKTSGGGNRLNIDDFSVTSYVSGSGGSASSTESESNNSMASANELTTSDVSLTGHISSSSDQDYFSFSGQTNQTVSVGLNVPSGKDYDLYLLNNSGTIVAQSENWDDASESISYTVGSQGTYYIRVVSYSGSSTTLSYTLTVSVSGGSTPPNPTPESVHLTFGNPTNATTNTSANTNYLMLKTGYAFSYNEPNANPNWVSWHLSSDWTGTAKRQDDFRADPELPEGWNRATGKAFGTGFDRGHMTPSADRTNTIASNSETFFMTNMLPQASNNNRGPWNKFEAYLRTLLPNEMYIIAGGHGNAGRTTQGGDVNIPEYTWKVVLILPNGDNDVSRVTTSTRTIAILIPNNNTEVLQGHQWQSYRVSVDRVEQLTGYNFFDYLPDAIENVIEATVDNL